MNPDDSGFPIMNALILCLSIVCLCPPWLPRVSGGCYSPHFILLLWTFWKAVAYKKKKMLVITIPYKYIVPIPLFFK